MSVLKKNIAANFGGGIWTGLMSLVFVPLYIRFIGIEAYGLIGVFASLLALFALLDMGLSNTLNREIARLVVQKDKAQDMRDIVRTLEILYWLVGVLIALTVVLASPLIAYNWVQVKDLAPDTVRTAIVLMGLCVAFRWPISFYSGGLMGLQRQVLLNGLNVAVATFRGLGAVLILWLVSPTVEAFFSWQIVVSVVHVGLITFFLWRSLPYAAETPRFRRELLLGIWRFAAGLTGITMLATILMQLDKIILSRMLSLDMFGYYVLANVVAMTLSRFVRPVFSATYPKLTNLVELGAQEEIIRLYHKSAQLVSVLVLPAAIVVALFSKEILLLWTQDPVTVEHTHLLVSIIIMGTAMNGLMHMPAALQYAFGWTRLSFSINFVSVLILAPLMIVLTKWYGAVGAASVWVILNGGYVLIGIHLMHRRLLPTEKWRWYVNDVARPFLAALAFAMTGRWIIQPDWPPLLLLVSLGVLSGGTLLFSAVVTRGLSLVADLRLQKFN